MIGRNGVSEMKDSTSPMGNSSQNGSQVRRTLEIECEAADWIAASEGTAWNEERQAQLEAWLAASTANRVAYLRLLSAWRRADRLQVLRNQTPSMAGRATASVAPRRAFGSALVRWPTFGAGWALGAGAVASLVLVAFLGVRLVESPPARDSLHATARGQQAAVMLADGSRVTLNTETRLRVELGDHGRHVRLEGGEAYFEVAPDAKHPFVVEAGRQRITVLGTKFTVRRDADRLRVLVVEGRVQVTAASGATALLKAADIVEATPDSLQLQHESPQVVKDLMGWLHGRLKLDGMTLEQAAAEFNRYNQRQLRISDAHVGAIRIGGTFDATNVEEFARLLRKGFGLTVVERPDVIEVGPPT